MTGAIDEAVATAGEASAAPGSAVVVPGSLRLRKPRQEKFAQGIAADLSEREAWIAAGYSAKAKNYYTLAKKPHVTARIAYLVERANDRDEGNIMVKKQWLQQTLIKIITADPTEFAEIGVDGNCIVTDRKKLGSAATRFEIDAAGRLKFEIDRKSALDSLAKTIGAFITKAELSGPDGGPVEVESISDADRIRALGAIFARIRAELSVDDIGRSAGADMPASPSASASEPEPPLAAARRALVVAAKAAQGAVADGNATEFLIAELRKLADAVESEVTRGRIAG